MRTHRTHEILAPWSTGTPVLDPARLAAVRIEPVLRQRRAAFALDLYLAGDDGDTVIPLAFADPVVVVERDRDPLIFPHGTPGDESFALGLAERVLPHLERLVLGGERVDEHVVILAAAPRFEAARSAGCFGAVRLRESLTRLAPYRYARRFARGRAVRIDAPDAIGGWALLRGIATVGVAASRRDPTALAWYGDAPIAGGRADIAIVDGSADATGAACVLRLDADGARSLPIVDPLPLDITVSFDSAEGPARRWFVVERALEPQLRAQPDLSYRAVGGSAGRIAVVLGRSDAALRSGADTDEATALISALRAEGFDAERVESVEELRDVDLIHLVGTRDGRRARAVVDAGRRAGVAVAVHAHDEEAERGGWWGAHATRYCFEYGSDERDVSAYLGLLARGAVAIGDVRAGEPFAPAEASSEDAAAALRDASVVFAATEEEANAIRRTGRLGPIVVVPPLAAVTGTVAIGDRVGPDPFALVHAPIGPLGNQVLVARCAADASIPLVVAGPIADASYLERVREFGGPSLLVLAGEPPPSVAAGLRAAAAVVVDAAWIGEGGSRLAAAALAGARLAIADRRRFAVPGVNVRRFDASDPGAVTRALGETWDEALRAPARIAPETLAALAPPAVVRTIVLGYARLAEAVT